MLYLILCYDWYWWWGKLHKIQGINVNKSDFYFISFVEMKTDLSWDKWVNLYIFYLVCNVCSMYLYIKVAFFCLENVPIFQSCDISGISRLFLLAELVFLAFFKGLWGYFYYYWQVPLFIVLRFFDRKKIQQKILEKKCFFFAQRNAQNEVSNVKFVFDRWVQ